MSIGLNEIDNAQKLVEYLELDGVEFHDCNPAHFFSLLLESVSTIWEDTDLSNYTNHNIKHSLRIISIFKKLDPIYEWINYEKFIFAVAAIIHDIGMQYNKWAPEKEAYPHFPKPPLNQKEIRVQHPELGFMLIRQQIKECKAMKFPPQLCDLSITGHKNSLHHAAHIAYAHSGTTSLDKLAQEKTILYERKFDDGKYRPGLLAGILRLCDELDGSYIRIDHPSEIFTWKVDHISTPHWLACLFIESVDVNIVEQVIEINLNWQVPEGSTKEINQEIKTFIDKFRVAKINNEIETIKSFFTSCEKLQYIKQVYIKPLPNEPLIYFGFNFDRRLLSLFEKGYKVRDKPSSDKRAESLSDNKKETTKSLISVEIEKEPLSLEESLRLWYEQNRDPGHFELEKQEEHTDTYLNCRTLVSDQKLLNSIADKIYKTHKENQIQCVLSVGTSAIPLGVILSYRFRCSATFTVSKSKVELEKHQNNENSESDATVQNYNLVEIKPIYSDNDNILIIDDVISGGTVAGEVLDLLLDNEKTPGKVWHHSIFRLGNRKYLRDERVVDYYYIMHIPEVMYSDESNCPLCKLGVKLVREREIF